jgi:hypothetical protein
MRSAMSDITAGEGNVSLQSAVPPSHLAVQVSTGNVTGVVPNSVSYHLSIADRTGVISDNVVDNPASPRVISLDVETGNVTLSQ